MVPRFFHPIGSFRVPGFWWPQIHGWKPEAACRLLKDCRLGIANATISSTVSISVPSGTAGCETYASAKSGLIEPTEASALKSVVDGIHVNALVPLRVSTTLLMY